MTEPRWTPKDTSPLPDVEPDQDVSAVDLDRAAAAWDAVDPAGLASILRATEVED